MDKAKKGRVHDQNGEKNASAKLSDTLVRQIRILSGHGLSNYKIARLLILKPGTVWHVVNGRTWIHVK